MLHHPDFTKTFQIECDASNTQLGMVLSQRDDNGILKPIYFRSCMLTSTERNYSTTERECLAIVNAVRMFRPYIFGHEFTVVTDHKALIWLDKHKSD